jgi:NodT family efflux transporter outer membrane factor (OMF) lipoprotein
MPYKPTANLTRFIVGGVFMSLAACSVGPDYLRPAATPVMPVAYKEGAGWKQAEPRDEALKGNWWQVYNDPQLNALEEQVVISNQSVLAAEAQYRQAQAVVEAARSGYYPTLALGASATRSGHAATSASSSTTPPPAASPAASGSTQTMVTATNYSLPATLSWELDIWGKVRRTVESSQASAQASAADLQAVRLSMQAQLAQNYFQLRTLDSQKQLLDATNAALRKSLQLTRNRYRGGVVSRADVLQAETQLRTTEAQAIDVGVQRAQLEHAIALLVGKPAAAFSIAPGALAARPPMIPVGVPSTLLERRPDIAGAERRAAAANAQIGVAQAAYFPTINLSGTGGYQSTDFANWLTWPNRFWSVGTAISQTVFDGGLRRAQNSEALAAYEATVANYRQTVLTGFQEVEDNLAALRILEDEARVQGEAVTSARHSRQIVENQYRAGIVSYLNVLVAQTAELADERTAIDIDGRRMAASILLIKALGGGWDAALLERVDSSAVHAIVPGTELPIQASAPHHPLGVKDDSLSPPAQK